MMKFEAGMHTVRELIVRALAVLDKAGSGESNASFGAYRDTRAGLLQTKAALDKYLDREG